jgi:long-subunit fatty acid transport protein
MKKKIVLLLFVVCATMSVSAQVYVGGTAGLWRNNKDDLGLTVFSVAPEVGYNLDEKWAIGAELGYGYAKVQSQKFNANVLHFSPYARYTCYEAGIVRLFLDGGLGIASVKVNGVSDRENGFEIGVKPGVAIKLTDKFSLIAKVGFLGYRDDYGTGIGTGEEVYDSQGFGFNLSGTDLKFGFQVNF